MGIGECRIRRRVAPLPRNLHFVRVEERGGLLEGALENGLLCQRKCWLGFARRGQERRRARRRALRSAVDA